MSLAVLAMTGCFLLARHTGQLFTGPSGVLAVLAGCSSLVAVRLQQQIFRIRRALGRPTFLRQQPGA